MSEPPRITASIADASIEYASLGFPVFPCHGINKNGCTCPKGANCDRSPGKHPKTANGLTDATTDLAQIREWFSASTANVAIRTGEGFFVLDVDGPDGESSLARLESENGPLPETLTCTSGREDGGRHLYFSLPEGRAAKSVNGGIAPHLDVKGEGGYVIAPPSLHLSGTRYAWKPGCDQIAKAPAWLVDLVAPRTTPISPVATVPAPSAERERVIHNGSRNSSLASLAGAMRRMGSGEAEILAALRVANDERCSTPLPEWEIQTIARSVARYEPHGTEPRAAPELPENEPRTLVERAEPSGGAPLYRIISTDEIFAPLEPPDFLVDRLILRKNVGIICATGASMKTWMALDLMISVSTGTPWMGVYECKGPGRTLIVDWESGNDELRRRIQRLCRGRGLERVEGLEIITMPTLWFNSKGFSEHLSNLARGRDLIVFDSLAAGSGGEDENDARIARGLNIMKAVAEETGCTFLVIHHARKSGTNGEVGDEREMLRGNSALFAVNDYVLTLRRGPNDITVCKHTKARCGREIEPFEVFVSDNADDTATTIEASATGLTAELPPIDRIKRAMLLALKRRPAPNKTTLYDLSGKGMRAVKVAALNELVADKWVVEDETGIRLANPYISIPPRSSESDSSFSVPSSRGGDG